MKMYLEIQYMEPNWKVAYQEVESGSVIRVLDCDGKEIVLPEKCESKVVDENPKRLDWMDSNHTTIKDELIAKMTTDISEEQKQILQAAIDIL